MADSFLPGDQYDPLDPTKRKPAVEPPYGAPGVAIGEPAPGTSPVTAPATSPAASQAGQWAPTNQGFLDWATKTYGAGSRRSGFVDPPQGQQFQDVLKRYSTESGNRADFQGGASGDRVDFGQGAQDALTSGGSIWNNESTGAGGPQGVTTPGSPQMPWSNPGLNPGGPSSAPGLFDAGPDVTGPGAFTPNQTAPDVQGPGAFTSNSTRGVNMNAGNPQSAVDTAGRQGILDLMSRSQQPVSMNDPALRAQSDAYTTARTRAASQQRSALAERMAATGLNSGGQGSGTFDTGLNGIYESSGQDIAGNDAGLMGAEVAARRADLTNSLQMANAVGARDEAQKIQLELSDLDNSYRFADLNQRGTQANQGMKLQADVANQGNAFNFANLNQSGKLATQDQSLRATLANQMNRANTNQLNSQSQLGNRGLDIQQLLGSRGLDLQALLGQGNLDLAGRRLDQDTSQWNDQYGLNREDLLQRANRDAILQALSGGGA